MGPTQVAELMREAGQLELRKLSQTHSHGVAGIGSQTRHEQGMVPEDAWAALLQLADELSDDFRQAYNRQLCVLGGQSWLAGFEDTPEVVGWRGRLGRRGGFVGAMGFCWVLLSGEISGVMDAFGLRILMRLTTEV